MNKQKNYRRRQRGITPITTPRNSPGVAQFSMSEVAQFSVSLDIRFQCFNAGSYECKVSMEFPMFLERSNPALFRQYQWERFHAGTTGGHWNCAHPPEILNLMAGGGSK